MSIQLIDCNTDPFQFLPTLSFLLLPPPPYLYLHMYILNLHTYVHTYIVHYTTSHYITLHTYIHWLILTYIHMLYFLLVLLVVTIFVGVACCYILLLFQFSHSFLDFFSFFFFSPSSPSFSRLSTYLPSSSPNLFFSCFLFFFLFLF
ncbi:hypothetical protein F4809DRAFT_383345 [Biscogniauxia mediterranea]|nr:hypothetical protein F4809DRAFT_383345 [Biscogniauxia mediterranea]